MTIAEFLYVCAVCAVALTSAIASVSVSIASIEMFKVAKERLLQIIKHLRG